MMKLKNNQGVTLLILTITIIVLLIITSIVIYNSKNHLAIKNINNLYHDIESISTKISDYYLKQNSLPVFENKEYLPNKEQLELLLVANGGDGEQINPNDAGPYYVINLSKIENLTLNYGREYEKWSEDSLFQTYQDLYIINRVTHQIYYPKGVSYNEKVYFTLNQKDSIVNKIETSSITDEGIVLTINEVNKTAMNEETRVIIEAQITLNLSSDYPKENLQYGWKPAGDTSEIVFSKFSLDETNSATLTSKLLKDSEEYELSIKVFDKNGYEHIVEQNVLIAENSRE